MADKGRKNGPMRLDRFLAEMGYGTRTQVKDMVKKGRVRMNGEAVKDADRKVNPESDIVEVDRSQVAYARMEYYMLNKPQGVVSATEDRKYPTVVGLIREALRKDLFPVGRLDIDTEGLLLITNDGELAHNLLSPKKHVDKVYPVSYTHLDVYKRQVELLQKNGKCTIPYTYSSRGYGFIWNNPAIGRAEFVNNHKMCIRDRE